MCIRDSTSAGDYIRILVKPTSNIAAVANTATVNEDATLTVTNGASENIISGASFVDSYTISEDTEPRGIAFSNDGKRMFITGVTNDRYINTISLLHLMYLQLLTVIIV